MDMRFLKLTNGIVTFFVGQKAAKETAKLMRTIRSIAITFFIFVIAVIICLFILTFYAVLKIVEWFMG